MTDPTENALRTTIQAAPPNTEWWKDDLVECMDGRCPWTGPRTVLEDGGCPECGSLKRRMRVLERGQWWYWSCSPGCLPDGEPMGPFATEADALEDAAGDDMLGSISEDLDAAILAERAARIPRGI